MSEILGMVTDEVLRNGKSSNFWQMGIRTLTGDTKAVIWDVGGETDALPHKGDIIRVDLTKDGVRDQRTTKYNNIIITIDGYEKVKPSDLSAEVVETLMDVPKASEQQLEYAYKIITDKTAYNDVNNFAFVMACLASVPKQQLFSCPAARSVHHAYQGGLIVHTAEVIALSRNMAQALNVKQLVDIDVVLAGATLHDIGKVLTYTMDNAGQPTSSAKEVMIGHLYCGMSIVEKVGKERNIDEDFLQEVLHVIASHHNKPEYGAIVEPVTLEAMIVAQADYIGSRAGIIETKLEMNRKAKLPLESEWRLFGRKYMVSRSIRKLAAMESQNV